MTYEGDGDGIVVFAVDGLLPDTQYTYALELDGALDPTAGGGFKTFGEGAYSFTIALWQRRVDGVQWRGLRHHS